MKKIPLKLVQQAGQFLREPQRLQGLIDESTAKAEENRRIGRGFLAQLRALFRLASAYMRGEYRDIPVRSVAAVVAALLYFINPMDLFPDVLLAGFIDDAAVVGLVLASLKRDLEAFSRWEDKDRGTEPSTVNS